MKLPTNICDIQSLSLNSSQFRISVADRPEWGEPDFRLNGIAFWGASQKPALIRDVTGASIGFFLGLPIDYKKREFVQRDSSCPVSCMRLETNVDLLEEWLYQFAGPWIAVISFLGVRRIYLDSNASMGVVFDRESRKAASTSAALLEKEHYVRRFRSGLFSKLDIANEGWFIAGLTAHHGVDRLLANHYLDLIDWVPKRHWPSPNSICKTEKVEECLYRIAAIVNAQVETLVSGGSVVCGLTAGYETRFLLCCMERLLTDVQFVTVAFSGARLDVRAATAIASQKKLNHVVLSRANATPSQRDEWLYNTGHCVGGLLAREHPSTNPLSEYDFLVTGAAGEVGRGFFYRRTDTGMGELKSKEIVARAGLPAEPMTVEAVESWLNSAPRLAAPDLLDLAYLELRMGPWGFASRYAGACCTEIYPMVCREVYELMFSLPYEIKRQNPLRSFIEIRDPELLKTPVNQYGDLRDQIRLLPRVFQPKRVVKKFRKLVG